MLYHPGDRGAGVRVGAQKSRSQHNAARQLRIDDERGADVGRECLAGCRCCDQVGRVTTASASFTASMLSSMVLNTAW